MQVWTVAQERTQKISSGTTHTELLVLTDRLRQTVQICTLDLTDPYTKVEIASYNGGVTALETVRNLAEAKSSAHRQVVAAINGDFFSHLGVPSGLQITNGEIITSPARTKVALLITGDNKARLLTDVKMAGIVRTAGGSLPICAVNRTRSLDWSNHLFLYNFRFGNTSKTPPGGVEAVIMPKTASSTRLYPGQIFKGTVLTTGRANDTKIPEKGLVLSAAGDKGKWLLNQLKEGTDVEIIINFDQGVNGGVQVVSGNSTLAYELVRDGQINQELLNPEHPFYSDSHPRTIIATKDEKLLLIVIDGRQPGYSDGVTFGESAEFLKSLGVDNAINIDGGGSTTCLVRPPGYTNLQLANSPSDGFERPVGNGLLVLNTAPVGKLQHLFIEPSGDIIRVLKGSELTISVKGVDQYFNPVILDQEAITWDLVGDVGEISRTGKLFATKEGSAGLRVETGGVSANSKLEVISCISQLVFEAERLVLEPNSKVSLEIKALDQKGRPAYLSPDIITWEIEGSIGSWVRPGTFLAADEFGDGYVTASFNGVHAKLEIQVGKEPLVLEDFETTKGLKIKAKNVVQNTVSFKQVSRPYPIRFGAFSGQLVYDFTGQTGNSSVSVQLLDEEGKLGRKVPGEPLRLGLWVYGDGQKHWLRLRTIDAAGNIRNLNLTTLGGLDWKGWRYVSADVPPNTVFPLTILAIVLLEPNDANKNSGVIYFDNLRAEYVNLAEDLIPPYFYNFHPSPASKITENQPEISVGIKDEQSGVNPNSIRMWLNDELVNHKFDSVSGLISYKPAYSLQAGRYQVRVEATDQAGNPTLPLEDWFFYVE